MPQLDPQSLNQIFREARTYHHWQKKPVLDELLQELTRLTNLGPTAFNAQPARITFIRSQSAKKRLEPYLSAGNKAQVVSAPVCAIIAYDLEFYHQLPLLFPGYDAKAHFIGNVEAATVSAFRNSSLQGGYFICAARALGLDVGPMSGFDNAGVDREFFPDGKFRSNFLCNVGYGDAGVLGPRAPRLDFKDMASIV